MYSLAREVLGRALKSEIGVEVVFSGCLNDVFTHEALQGLHR